MVDFVSPLFHYYSEILVPQWFNVVLFDLLLLLFELWMIISPGILNCM